MKIIIFGLKNAGKTSLIEHVLGGKSWNLIKTKPTEFLDTSEYLYRGLFTIHCFDCGGQDQFLEQYYQIEWVNNIFSNCAALFFVVDSSNKSSLKKAKSEFYKVLKQVKECSAECEKITVVISKTDLAEKSPKEIRKYFSDHPDFNDAIKTISVSIPKNTARKNIAKMLNQLIPEESKSKQTKLNNICKEFNKKFKSDYSLLLNKTDGLEIASSIESELVASQISEELEYTSLKALTHSEEESEIFKLLADNKLISSNNISFRLYQTSDLKHIIILQDFSEKTGFFAIINADAFNYEKVQAAIEELKFNVIEILHD